MRCRPWSHMPLPSAMFALVQNWILYWIYLMRVRSSAKYHTLETETLFCCAQLTSERTLHLSMWKHINMWKLIAYRPRMIQWRKVRFATSRLIVRHTKQSNEICLLPHMLPRPQKCTKTNGAKKDENMWNLQTCEICTRRTGVTKSSRWYECVRRIRRISDFS